MWSNTGLAIPLPGTDIEIKHLIHDFGAVGNGVDDDTAALNAAFAWLRDYPDPDPPLIRPAKLVGWGGVYRCNGAVDATGINGGRSWEVEGVGIHSFAAGKTAIDFTGMRFGSLRNIRVWGAQTTQPHCGLLLARNAGTCSNNIFYNVDVDGYFTQSTFTMYAAEVNSFYHCNFWNRRVPDGGGESWAAILQGTDFKAMISDFQTLSTGRQSFTVNNFHNCTFQKPFGVIGPTVFLQDMGNMHFESGYVTNGGGSAFVWRLTGTFVPYDIEMHFQQETTGTDRFIQFTSDAASTRDIVGLDITFGNCFCDQELFNSDTLTGLTIKNFVCHLYRLATGVTLANKMFNPALASVLTLRDASLLAPAVADLPTLAALANFTGRMASMDGFHAEFNNTSIYVFSKSGVAVSHTGDLVEFTLRTVTIPGKLLGINGQMEIEALWSFTNNANAKNARVRFAGQLINSQPATASASARYVCHIANRGAVNSQVATSSGIIGIGNSGVVSGTFAINTDVDQDVTFLCLLANAGDTATLEGYVIKIMRGA